MQVELRADVLDKDASKAGARRAVERPLVFIDNAAEMLTSE